MKTILIVIATLLGSVAFAEQPITQTQRALKNFVSKNSIDNIDFDIEGAIFEQELSNSAKGARNLVHIKQFSGEATKGPYRCSLFLVIEESYALNALASDSREVSISGHCLNSRDENEGLRFLEVVENKTLFKTKRIPKSLRTGVYFDADQGIVIDVKSLK